MAVERNPYAFPALTGDDEYNGMTLRDWFAGQVMGGFAANLTGAIESDLPSYADELAAAARLAYMASDAMLAARQEQSK